MARIDMKQAAGFLLAGGVAGVALALLYAPQSGSRTRRDIRKFAGTTLDRLDVLQGDIRVQVSDWVDDVTEVVKDAVARGNRFSVKGREQVLQGLDTAKTYIDEGKDRIEQLIGSSTENS